jgi:formylglycine-generating enzyme required for sulfatase activity
VSGTGDIRQWWRYVPGANWRHPGGPGTDIRGRGAFPVVAVTHDDALAYARWRGRALPTEVQWEWAASAGQPPGARAHAQPREANTWQGLFPVVNSADDGFVGLAPVGCYAANASYCMRYRAGARQAQEGDLGASHVGFRTILNAPGP